MQDSNPTFITSRPGRCTKHHISGSHKCSLNPTVQLGRVELILIEDEHATIQSKREIGSTVLDKDLSEKNAARRPDVNAVTTTGIHIAFGVNLDAIRDTLTGHGKEATV